MRPRKSLDRLLSVLLTAAAIVMAAAVTYRELVPVSSRENGTSTASEPRFYNEWPDLLSAARRLDGTPALIHLVEFGDLECPACRQFHTQTLPMLRKEFGDAFGASFVHLPLRMHRFAKQAAHAAECAAQQGSFAEFVEETFAKQDSIGLKPWSAFAKDAGVRDSSGFVACLVRPETAALVDSGLAIAERLGIRSTPTVFVNGWRLPSAAPEALANAVANIAGGGSPLEYSATRRN